MQVKAGVVRTEWSESPPMTRAERGIVAAFAGIVLVLGALLLEERILSTQAQGTVVTILRAETPQQTEGPPLFRYQVQMPDGATAEFRSGQLYRAGMRVKAISSRGLVTGTVRLRDPSSAVVETPQP